MKQEIIKLENTDSLPQRKTIRKQGYDYSQAGAYFITICTKDKAKLLSDIRRGGALLRPLGMIADNEIRRLPERYPDSNVSIPIYVIMPNHIHMVIVIERAEQSPVMRAEQSPAPTVGDMVCAFKSITTKAINKQDNARGRQIWQRSYHDRIIRSEQEYGKIWQYIENNPLFWEQDCFYTE